MTTWTKEQKDAIEKSGTNIIVSAGAGSGKTEVLSERVINNLKKGIHIDEHLILTFTRAAAEEMKNRIRRKIIANKDLLEESERIDSSYITTFDSYALSIVKRYNYLLNIKKDINITDESIIDLVRVKLLDELFLDLYKKRDEKFLNLISTYSIKSDKEIKNSILSLIKVIDNKIDRDEYLDSIINKFNTDDFINQIVNKYEGLVSEKKSEIKSRLDNLNLYFDNDFTQKISEVVMPLINYSIDELASMEFKKLPNAPRGSEDAAKKAKGDLGESIKELKNLVGFGTISDVKNDIKNTFSITSELSVLLKEYFVLFDNYKKENEIYSFMDIAKLAISIFKNYPDARNEVKNSLKEIMIDEYQDTNDIQEVFISYIENNNVYMVGDIKQSIYKFRGSNPLIFKNKYDKYSNSLGGIKIDLLKNFRSRSEVLDNINLLFGLIMDNDLGGAEYLESHIMEAGNSNYDEYKDDTNYNMEILEYENESEYKNSEIEIFTIARDIEDKIKNMKVFDKTITGLRSIKYSDFAIILDRSTYFNEYKRIFDYLGIPIEILRDGELNASIDLELIKNIINLIIKIKDNEFDTMFKLSFMSVGRSFLYEYSDEYLFDTITNEKYGETSVYKDLEKIDNINAITSSELLDKILEITEFYKKLSKVGDYLNTNVRLEAISNLSKNLSSLGYTIYEFRDYLDTIISENKEIKYEEWKSNSDSVKILTTHKSKGLEYPVCYFADLDHDFNLSDIKSKFISTSDYGIIVPNNEKESLIKYLYKEDYKKDEISERIRLFYVALTRAREKIIIVLPKKEEETYEKGISGALKYEDRLNISSLGDIIYTASSYLTEFIKLIDLNNLGLTKAYLYKKDIKNIEYSEAEEFIVEEISINNSEVEEETYSKNIGDIIDESTYNNMEFGTKLHELLEYTDFKNIDVNVINNAKIRTGISNFISKIDLNYINALHEYEFYYENGDNSYHGVIDLILEYDNHIDIIDYKLSNISDENYKKQLNGYKKYIGSISNKPIKCYLYSILNNELKEIN